MAAIASPAEVDLAVVIGRREFASESASGAQVLEICRQIAERLDVAEQRLASSAHDFDHADAEQLDYLALEIDDLLAQHRAARDQAVTGLESLYEAPFSDPLGATLEQLAEQAAKLRDRAWSHVGVPLSARPDPGPVPMSVELYSPSVPAPIAPVVATHDSRPRTDPWKIVAEVLTALGVLGLLFVLYVIFGTGLTAARSQRFLDREFDIYLRKHVAVAAANDAGQEVQSGILGQTPAAPESTEPEAEAVDAVPAPALPSSGDPVAILSVPTIGVRQIVVEGTTAEELTAGPGHLKSTPLPGRAGNSVIFGRRTTYGAPFRHLDDVQPGDPIDVVTEDGLFRYIVQSVERVGPGDPDPIGTTFTNRLTLVTADEQYSAGGRLVAISRLEGSPVASPTTADGRLLPLPAVGPDDIGTQRTGTDWAVLLVWTQVLVVSYLGARWVYRHWLPWSSWIVSAPILLVVAFAWFDSIARLLPSTL